MSGHAPLNGRRRAQQRRYCHPPMVRAYPPPHFFKEAAQRAREARAQGRARRLGDIMKFFVGARQDPFTGR